jgi:hypothetical protein
MRDRLTVIGGNLTIETCPGGDALLGARLKARGAMQLTAARITDPPATALLLRSRCVPVLERLLRGSGRSWKLDHDRIADRRGPIRDVPDE